jgi:phosphate transport system substrate-binding protein
MIIVRTIAYIQKNVKISMKSVVLPAVLLLLLLVACADRDRKGNRLDTPTSGSIKIAVDESLLPLLDAEVKAFEGIYKNAHVAVTYTSEQDAIDLLLKDSVRLIVITRQLTDEEKKALSATNIVPQDETIAKDGIALILHPDNPDTLLSVEQLKSVLTGKISTWDQVSKRAKSPIEVVFDHPNSGMVRFLRDSLAGVEKLAENCFAVDNNPSVIDHVSSKPNAIGVIGVSWISDKDDSTSNRFLDRIKVAGLKNDSSYFQPYQAYIAQKEYPLVRNIIMISREARAGLGSGFMSFAASDRGQRIVLKAGLVPATMPIRIVEVNHQPL